MSNKKTTRQKKKKNVPDYDSPWKDILDEYFPEFLAFFFPNIHKEVDWSKGHVFMDKELQQFVKEAEFGRRYADKLVKVWHIDGRERWILIHVEVQGNYEANFPRRTYVYNYRLFDQYGKSVVSLVVLTDEKEEWKPNQYKQELWGCNINFEYPVVKLIEYQERWAALEKETNLFAVVVMAHLKTLETKGDNDSRLRWKIEMVRQLYKRGLSRDDVVNLFKFIDWIMLLPDGLRKGFWNEVQIMEEERRMRYITTVEEIGYERGHEEGREEGREEGQQSLIINRITEKFDNVPQHIIDQISQTTDADQLWAWIEQIVTADSLDDIGL